MFDGEKVEGFSLPVSMQRYVKSLPKVISHLFRSEGKRVSVGDIGSGVEFNSSDPEAYGMSFDDIVVNNLSFGDSATALKDDKIDAFFCVAVRLQRRS